MGKYLASERIRCTVCGKEMVAKYFAKKQLHIGTNVCKYCVRAGIKKKKDALNKVRKCLKCDKNFLSRNGYRICNPCHGTEEYKNHTIEYSVDY